MIFRVDGCLDDDAGFGLALAMFKGSLVLHLSPKHSTEVAVSNRKRG